MDRESVIGITFAVILFSPFLCYDVRMDFNFLNQKNLKEKGKKGKQPPKFSGNIMGAVLIFMIITALYLMISDTSKNAPEVSISDLAKSISVREVRSILVEGEKLTITYKNDEVKIFLMGEGVDYEKSTNEKFNIQEQVEKFLQSDKAKILACGTCIKSRNRDGSTTCPINTMKDLYDIIKESDKIITF